MKRLTLPAFSLLAAIVCCASAFAADLPRSKNELFGLTTATAPPQAIAQAKAAPAPTAPASSTPEAGSIGDPDMLKNRPDPPATWPTMATDECTIVLYQYTDYGDQPKADNKLVYYKMDRESTQVTTLAGSRVINAAQQNAGKKGDFDVAYRGITKCGSNAPTESVMLTFEDLKKAGLAKVIRQGMTESNKLLSGAEASSSEQAYGKERRKKKHRS